MTQAEAATIDALEKAISKALRDAKGKAPVAYIQTAISIVLRAEGILEGKQP